MSDIFLSYSKEDIAHAKIFVAALKDQGWTVFWDHDLKGGADFSEVIEKELEAANCVIVLWSRISVISGWVRDEADAGKVRDILVPVQIDDVPPPMGFRTIHTVNLSKWRGAKTNRAFKKLIQDINAKLADAPKRTAKKQKSRVHPRTRTSAGDNRTRIQKETGPGFLKAIGLGNVSKAQQQVAFGALILLLLAGSFYFGRQQVEQAPQLSWRELKALEDQETRNEEVALWKLAKKQNIVIIFKSYLKAYPDGQFRTEALQKIDELQGEEQNRLAAEEAKKEADKLARAADEKAWNVALSKNSIESYEVYLKDQAGGRNRQTATQILAALKADAQERKKKIREARLNAETESLRRDDTEWEQARSTNTIKSYKSYLVSHDKGRHREKANQIIAALEIAEKRNQQEETERKADEQSWARAEQANRKAGYEEYLASQPDGKFRAQARERLAKLQAEQVFARAKDDASQQAEIKKREREQQAWARALKRNTIGGYSGYLEAHPNDSHSDEATAKREKLRSAIPNQKILAIYEGIDFFGSDIDKESPARRVRSLKACWSACYKENGCNVFTYNTKARWCYLKFVKRYEEIVFDEKIATSGFISESHDGEPEPIVYPIVTMENGVEYSGENLPEQPFKITQKGSGAHHCRAACFAENKCTAFTYNNQSNKRECTLIEKINERKDKQSSRIGGKKLPDRKSVSPSKTVNLGRVR